MSVFHILLTNLRNLFAIRNFINGKVDMQKSLYFMKELGHEVPFNFRWSKLGPYSYELANIVERMTTQGYLRYTGRYDLVERNFRFIEPVIDNKTEDFFLGIERVCNRNDFNQVNFIECAASIHFIYKNSHNKTRQAILSKLANLKPARMSAFEPLMENAWNFLREQKLIVVQNANR